MLQIFGQTPLIAFADVVMSGHFQMVIQVNFVPRSGNISILRPTTK